MIKCLLEGPGSLTALLFCVTIAQYNKWYETWFIRMNRKSVTTCYWFQIIFVLQALCHRIWTRHFWTIKPYMTYFIRAMRKVNHVLATSVCFNIGIYIYLNEITLQKPVTCRHQLSTHLLDHVTYICAHQWQQALSYFLINIRRIVVHSHILYNEK